MENASGRPRDARFADIVRSAVLASRLASQARRASRAPAAPLGAAAETPGLRGEAPGEGPEGVVDPRARLRDAVFEEIVVPDFVGEVAALSSERRFWRRASDRCDDAAQLAAGAAVLLSLALGFFGLRVLAFLAGAANAFVIVALRYSAYARRECAERDEARRRQLAAVGGPDLPGFAPGGEGSASDGFGQLAGLAMPAPLAAPAPPLAAPAAPAAPAPPPAPPAAASASSGRLADLSAAAV